VQGCDVGFSTREERSPGAAPVATDSSVRLLREVGVANSPWKIDAFRLPVSDSHMVTFTPMATLVDRPPPPPK
jgi:hypothetical protein